MQIVRLIYASVARPNLSYDQVRQILSTASAHNEAHGITGILCYSSGAFLQALEGKRVPVNKLYNRIIRDVRHTDCEILSCGPIEVRSFIEWTMKMISWDESFTPQRRALVLRHSGMNKFEPWIMTGKQAHGFLKELAELERRRETLDMSDVNVL
jgi:hypothetical protein